MQKTEIRVEPFISVNGIKYGTPREDVWKALVSSKELASFCDFIFICVRPADIQIVYTTKL